MLHWRNHLGQILRRLWRSPWTLSCSTSTEQRDSPASCLCPNAWLGLRREIWRIAQIGLPGFVNPPSLWGRSSKRLVWQGTLIGFHTSSLEAQGLSRAKLRYRLLYVALPVLIGKDYQREESGQDHARWHKDMSGFPTWPMQESQRGLPSRAAQMWHSGSRRESLRYARAWSRPVPRQGVTMRVPSRGGG